MLRSLLLLLLPLFCEGAPTEPEPEPPCALYTIWINEELVGCA